MPNTGDSGLSRVSALKPKTPVNPETPGFRPETPVSAVSQSNKGIGVGVASQLPATPTPKPLLLRRPTLEVHSGRRSAAGIRHIAGLSLSPSVGDLPLHPLDVLHGRPRFKSLLSL